MKNEQTAFGWNLETTYHNLPKSLYSEIAPESVPHPKLVFFNSDLAKQLGLNLDDQDDIADLFSGNKLPHGSKPIAQAYAGHQFGYFNILGDGRAVLLGEQITPNNQRFDIQLKGSGKTPYSRRGDGKATLKSMLREYLISEAMFHFGIPTSRSLAVVSTGEKIQREELYEGGILTRVASSHIRVGTFEYVKHQLGLEELKIYTQYVIQRHYPHIANSENPVLELIKTVMHKQIDLVVDWMRVGFIHGVMNTDNTTISGETIDYGPCAFMNTYNPSTVFSSIDQQGRYAYSNQPGIIQWNIMCLAGALLPLIHENEKIAIDQAQQLLNSFPQLYEQRWLDMMCAKIGIENTSVEDAKLVSGLLDWMKSNQMDYTNTFIDLETQNLSENLAYTQEFFKRWYEKWTSRIGKEQEIAKQRMRKANPFIIPRNHLVEQALDNAAKHNNFDELNQLLLAIQSPYSPDQYVNPFNAPPESGDDNFQTFCGT